MGRTPATGATIKIAAKTVAKITALKGFKDIALGVAPAPKLNKAGAVAAAAAAKAPAKKAVAKKAPARKTPAKKVVAKKAPARKAPAKKKAAAKKR
jgi:hypothetical protein